MSGIDFGSLLEQKQAIEGPSSARDASSRALKKSSSHQVLSKTTGKMSKKIMKERPKEPAKVTSGYGNSVFVLCIKRLVPLGMSILGGVEQELLQYAKRKLLNEVKVTEDPNWLELAAQVLSLSLPPPSVKFRSLNFIF